MNDTRNHSVSNRYPIPRVLVPGIEVEPFAVVAETVGSREDVDSVVLKRWGSEAGECRAGCAGGHGASGDT